MGDGVTALQVKQSNLAMQAAQKGNAASIKFADAEAAFTAASASAQYSSQCFVSSKNFAGSAKEHYAKANSLRSRLTGDKSNDAAIEQEIQREIAQAQTFEQMADEKMREGVQAMQDAGIFKQTAEQNFSTAADYNKLAETYKTEAETLRPEIDKAKKEAQDALKATENERNKLPADALSGKRQSGGVQPGTTDPTTGLTKQPGESDEEFAKKVRSALGLPDKGLGAGTGSAGGLVSAARGLLSQIAMNAARTISSNPIVMIAKNLFNKSLGEQAVALLEAAQIEEVLGSGIKQQIILLHAQAKTIVGESTANVEFWKQVIQENKQLARATHELAKGAA